MMALIILGIITLAAIYGSWWSQREYRKIEADCKDHDRIIQHLRDSEQLLLGKVNDLESANARLREKNLTQIPKQEQDKAKRFSGSELRRLVDAENAAVWDSLQERPNSEILKEQKHGRADA